MFWPSPRKLFIRRAITTGFAFSSTLACALVIQAQMGGIDPDPGDRGTGGRSTIQGRVFFPSGRTVDHRLKVTLTSVAAGEFRAYTDDSGAFAFRRLSDGTYTIVVDAGKEYLPARETVVVAEPTRRGARGSTFTVQIQLQLKGNENNKAALLDAALAGVPKAALEFYQQGMQLAEAGRSREAIDKLKLAVSLYPQFVVALNQMSALYINLGEGEPAADALRAALKIEPNNPTLRLNYGYVLMLKKQFADSERELYRAIQLKDDLVSAHLYRGRVLIRLRNFDEAEKELKRALSLGGSSGIVAYRYLGALYSERGETSKAIAALENYLKLNPNGKDAEQVQSIVRKFREEAANKRD